ncbi:MAG: hypothetical protein EXR57_03695 [Dehalococcoidia bacterium]|nr:hypothetical protein [Dehalococcoidia bacterium]
MQFKQPYPPCLFLYLVTPGRALHMPNFKSHDAAPLWLPPQALPGNIRGMEGRLISDSGLVDFGVSVLR